MKRHHNKVVIEVRDLRRNKRFSFRELSRITGVPSSTLRNWCLDIPVGTKRDTLLSTNERKRQEFRVSEENIVNDINIRDSNKAKFYAALLYWCEGSKYPSSTAVTMVNSDPSLMKVFVKLLRSAFILDESKFHVHLQIHTTQSIEQVNKYWSELLTIPVSQFMRPTITVAKGNKHRSSYSGTCTLKYQDYRILLKLTGIYEAFARKIS